MDQSPGPPVEDAEQAARLVHQRPVRRHRAAVALSRAVPRTGKGRRVAADPYQVRV